MAYVTHLYTHDLCQEEEEEEEEEKAEEELMHRS
jgi:hypothetical protein